MRSLKVAASGEVAIFVQNFEMKFLRGIIAFIIALFVSLFMLSFFAPDQQQVVRSIVINAPVQKVYEQLLLLQNFNTWSVWNTADSSIRYTPGKVTDGQVGSSITWSGDPLLSGKGKIALTGLIANKEVAHHISLLAPQKLEADSKFELQDNNGAATVSWTFTIPSRKPWNVLNIFYSLDKDKGKDFEKGLQALKAIVENTSRQEEDTISVRSIQFPATRYVGIKQRVLWVDFQDFFTRHFHHLEKYTLNDKVNTAVRTGLFYSSDDKALQSDVAAAIRIPGNAQPKLQNPEELIDLKTSRGIEVRTGSGQAAKDKGYKALDAFTLEKQLKIKVPTIEEYNTKDSSVRIIYLIE